MPSWFIGLSIFFIANVFYTIVIFLELCTGLNNHEGCQRLTFMLLDQDTVAAVSHQQHLFSRAFPLLVVAFFLIILTTIIKPTLLEPFVVAEQTMTRADALMVMAGSRSERGASDSCGINGTPRDRR